MADKEKDGDKGGKPERAPKIDKSPEAAARAEKAQAAKAKAAKKEAGAAEKAPREPEERVTPRLRTPFRRGRAQGPDRAVRLQDPMQVPKIDKVVLNMGIGEAVNDRKKAELAAADLSLIAGQKAIITYSRVDRDLQAA